MKRFLISLASAMTLVATAPLLAQDTTNSQNQPEPLEQVSESLNSLITTTLENSKGSSRYDALIVPAVGIEEIIWNGKRIYYPYDSELKRRVPTVESVQNTEENVLKVVFDSEMGRRKWDDQSIRELEKLVRSQLSMLSEFPNNYEISLNIAAPKTGSYDIIPIETWSTSNEQIRARQLELSNPVPPLTKPVVQHVEYAGPDREQGMHGLNYVIGASHGWTWHKENRWQFQRARVFTIVEDLFPQSYVNPFLLPMLENAGANAWSVRERDYQMAEVIVDNTPETEDHKFNATGSWQSVAGKGWKGGRPASLGEYDEPFTWGDSLQAVVGGETSSVEYIPTIPRSGNYAVYASWVHSPTNSDSVPYTIEHAGGSTTVRVNQKAAGTTWVYLGHYYFDQTTGENQTARITVTTDGAALNDESETTISVDAVRIGGGMGNIAPEDQISGKPRYAEGARYYTQYAGAPSEMVTNRKTSVGHFGVDYNEDITSRGEMSNYIQGAPSGPNGFRNDPGLGVPVDAFVAWHTDAGGSEDGLIGTLTIYSLEDDEGDRTFPDGRSRWLNRDLAVIMMDEMIRTGRELYSSSWAKRDVREVGFGETRRPNSPSALIELLSHHNPNDMKYGNDPRFKKDMARAVYKSLLKFDAYAKDREYVVQPLEPTAVSARHLGNGVVELIVTPQSDPLEPTAEADGFVVYQSTDGHGFDNGTYYEGTTIQVSDIPEKDTTYFKVTAANAGGESLPAPIVGVRWASDSTPSLIVDGFNRISGPAIIDQEGAKGFDRRTDPGVGYHYNYALVGDQYNFDFNSEWENDLENPGRGGSLSNMESSLEIGNKFNQIVMHGELFESLDLSFDSMTGTAFSSSSITTNDYPFINWVAGEQRTVEPFIGMENEGKPDKMKPEFEVLTDRDQRKLVDYLDQGGNLIISGSYIADDLINGALASPESIAFAKGTLGIREYTPFATKINALRPAEDVAAIGPARFGNDLEETINIAPTVYKVEQAEGFETSATPLIEYADSGSIAGFASDNVAVFGFPLETVLPESERQAILREAMDRLK